MIYPLDGSKAITSLLVAILLSVLMVSCDGNSSSNDTTKSRVIGNESGGSTVTIDGATVTTSPDGNVINQAN